MSESGRRAGGLSQSCDLVGPTHLSKDGVGSSNNGAMKRSIAHEQRSAVSPLMKPANAKKPVEMLLGQLEVWLRHRMKLDRSSRLTLRGSARQASTVELAGEA